MQRLLGMCIENTNDMSHTISMSFDVQDIMKRIQEKMSEEKKREAENDSGAIIAELSKLLDSIT